MEGVCESCRSVEESSYELMLENASRSGHYDCLKILIQAGADVNWINKDTKNTALTHAARDGHENCLKLLLDAGADVNLAVEKFSDEGEKEADRPLMLAADNGHVNCVRILIESGADVNAKTKNSYTAVHGAVHRGNQAYLDLLVKAGADVNVYHSDETPVGEIQGTPLQMICYKGNHPHLVKPLVDAGANMEDSKLPHEKPLFIAAAAGHYKFIDALVELGADVNIRGFDQMTSLMYVAGVKENESDQTEAVNFRKSLDLLLKAGADVNMVGGVWSSALMDAAERDNCYAVERLLQAGADVDLRSNQEGETALMWLAEKGCRDCALALIDAGADVNSTNDSDVTTLMCAAQSASSEINETLIKKGANVNETATFGFTALMCAAECGFYDSVRTLINAGADANMTSTDGETALFFPYNVKCSQVLLGSGAKINIRNKHEQNALQNWIKEKWYIKQRKVIKCLFAAGETPPDDATVRGIAFKTKMEESGIVLKQMCREAIRKHLLELDPHAHLFHRVPRLGLPSLLTEYLLYNISLDDNDDDAGRTDDENDDNIRPAVYFPPPFFFFFFFFF